MPVNGWPAARQGHRSTMQNLTGESCKPQHLSKTLRWSSRLVNLQLHSVLQRYHRLSGILKQGDLDTTPRLRQ